MNEDLLEVIAGLECCIDPNSTCDMCPHKNKRLGLCIDFLMMDALEILREVERDGLY